MSDTNVLNEVKQPGGPKGSEDNVLELGGTVISPGGASVTNQRVTVDISDISTADSVFVTLGVACTFVSFTAIVYASPDANEAITTEIGGVAVTGGTMTIPSTAVIGEVVAGDTPTALNVLTASQGLEIITPGTGSTTARVTFTVEFELS